MQTDKQIAGLCAAIYDPASQWDKIWNGTEPGDIYAGIKDNCLIFRGSITTEDWLRDFWAAPHTPTDHPQLGQVHAGFYEGMDEFFKEAAGLLGANPVIGGHSLGAARAWLFAGRYVAEGGHPGRITVFGSPRPGCQQLKDLLAPCSKASYRNGLDPVPTVPIWLPDFPVVAPLEPMAIRIEPTDWTEGFMAWHNIALYAQADLC